MHTSKYRRQAAQAIFKNTLQENYEPQYRCQPDNTSSIASVKRAKYGLTSEWNYVFPESVEKL